MTDTWTHLKWERGEPDRPVHALAILCSQGKYWSYALCEFKTGRERYDACDENEYNPPYDDATDDYYWHRGWHRCSTNSVDEETLWLLSETEVVAWTELPDKPAWLAAALEGVSR